MDTAVCQRVLIDEAVEVPFERAGHFARSPGARPIHEACHALGGKALHPFSESGIGKVEGRRDGVDVVASDYCTDSLRPAKDAHLLGLLQHGL